MGRNLLIFLSTAFLWDSFLHSSSTWISKLKCRSVVSPRSFWRSTCSIFEFPRKRFNKLSTIWFVRRFPVTKRHFVLAAFVTILLAADRCEWSSRSCWRADLMQRSPSVTSDEKPQMSTLERWAAKGRSLIKRRNITRPNIPPCGTPAVTVLGEERHPSMTTYCLLSLR